MFPEQPNTKITDSPQDLTDREFVTYVRSQLSQTMGEIAMRNGRIQQNDAYIYGDLLDNMLDIPIGHDKTSVNWLRRTVEIHRTQFMGRGFSVGSTYTSVDINDAPPDSDPYAAQEKKQLILQNNKRKAYADLRKKIIDQVLRDNGGKALFANGAENASAVGDWIVKTWYDEEEGKYHIAPVEAVEHCFAIWKKNDFREWDLFAYVYQISKDEAQKQFDVGPDVQTSPLGVPLSVLSTANTVEYISTQPMVTIMEITGLAQGWGTDGAGNLKKVAVGDENPLNAVIVGANVYKLIDDKKKLPNYYIFPNKKQRRRPWGMPDVSKAAVNLNLTYIETLSDWRTSASRVNFPKFKYLGFAFGTQLPKPKPRTVEGIPLTEGQDIQPLQNPNSTASGELDFQRQLEEVKNEYVREVGIGRVLFDDPDLPMNSAQALKSALQSMGDITAAKQQLWEPILVKMFTDMLNTLAEYDDNIKEIVKDDEDWNLNVAWPSMLNKDDPVWHTMLVNRLNTNSISIQSYLEALGENPKEEIDRIRDEMEDPLTAAIHGRMLTLLAEFKIAGPPTSAPPKINVNLRGDITPEQETNLSVMHQFGDGPVYGPSSGPQGELGIRATDDAVNSVGQPGARVTGQGYTTGQPVITGGQPVNSGTQQGSQPEPIQAGPANNAPGTQPVSTPGSGAPAVTPQGKLNQKNQRKGK